MSSVNLSGATNGLYQFLQNVSSDISNASGTTNSNSISTAIQTLAQQLQPAGHHHHGGGFMRKIQQAVTSALQSSQGSSSTDPNQTIQNAIAQVLNGTGSSDADGDGDSANPPTSAPGSNAPANFLQTLQSYGITPAQFRQDFLAALQNVQGSASTGLQNVPAGLTVDTLG
jgi:hypothetical protein